MFQSRQNTENAKRCMQDNELRDRTPTRRFRIERLEERIAPSHGPHPGKYCFAGCQLHNDAPMPWSS